MFLDGRHVAEKLSKKIQIKQDETNGIPGLGVVLVGDDAPSHLYVGIKEKKAAALGIAVVKKIFPTSAATKEVIAGVEELNVNPNIHGIIVQVPLPAHIDTEAVIRSIDPTKDADGFHPETIEKFLEGDDSLLPVFPRAMLELVNEVQKENLEKKAVAAVNSHLMGNVLTSALKNAGYQAEYVLQDNLLQEKFREADVVFSALGKPGFFSALNAKSGAVLVDGGISYDEKGKVVGDITRDDGVYRDDVWVTPVPGGVGPVTVAVLLARVVELAKGS